ncbi:MAG: radical SAM protein [Lachnospiraceae bacterium]|nr:radical SAM protein [Lachnospiraceae bacterium]
MRKALSTKSVISKIAIAMTDKCSASCEMCCFKCSPEGKNTLSTDFMKDVILQASKINGIQSIGFTGGDPFMVFDQLLECSAYAHSLGLRVSVNTNGFWGKNEKRAFELVGKLKEAGVESMSFSADHIHQEYVPIADLKMAMRAVTAHNMLLDVTIMETSTSENIVRMTEALRPEIYQSSIANHPMLPAGNALEKVKEGEFIRYFASKAAYCPFFGMASLNFDGNYYMCCSQFCREIPPLNLGSAHEVKLADLDRRISSNDYLYVMLRRGLSWYVDLAGQLGYEIPQYLCSPCHCCYYVFRNEKLLDEIKETVKNEAGRLRVSHLLGN